jgi:hypothetical protein
MKKTLTFHPTGDIILRHVWGSYACNAMMQEIALKNGNFCGVCPVIGRLNASAVLAYIAGQWKNGRRLSANFHAPE